MQQQILKLDPNDLDATDTTHLWTHTPGSNSRSHAAGSITFDPDETPSHSWRVASGGLPRRDWVNLNAVKERLSRVQWRSDKKYGIDINPVTTIMTTVVLWSLIALCLFDPGTSQKMLQELRESITDMFSWLYIGTQNVWVVFVIWISMSRFASLKLGKPDEKPEYGHITWFMMLLCCGIGNEMFYYGVGEPIDHYVKYPDVKNIPHRYASMPRNERAEMALLQTTYHYGPHGWCVYTIVALAVGIPAFRKGLPVTMRTALYPLLGDKVYGFIGNCIDSLSAVCTLIGVCTVLGIGVLDIGSGLQSATGCPRLTKLDCDSSSSCSWNDLGFCKPLCEWKNETACGRDDTCDWEPWSTHATTGACFTKMGEDGGSLIPDDLKTHVALIWVITALATISATTGMKLGIRAVSSVCFCIGTALLVYVSGSDGCWYFLDVICQQIGLFLQWILSLGFHTDAFARHTVVPETVRHLTSDTTNGSTHGAADWLDKWTIFYWGWWIAWCPFVGTFIAKISRGRSIREVVIGSMMAPFVYAFIWFAIFGSSGIKMERFAESARLNFTSSPAYIKYNSTTHKPIFHGSIVQTCTKGDEFCQMTSRLSNRVHGDMWMDMISQYGDLGMPMKWLSLIGILLYFITSADSGSLVIDTLNSNGIEETPLPQKIFWAFTQSTSATALLILGSGDDGSSTRASQKSALEALQAASLCAGLPYTIMLCLMQVALVRACKYEYGELQWKEKRFWRVDLTDFLDLRFTRMYRRRLQRSFTAMFVPMLYVWKALAHVDFASQRLLGITLNICFYLAPFCGLLGILDIGVNGLEFFGLFCYICFVASLAMIRQNLRSRCGLDGNLAEDFFACFFLFFGVADQLDEHFATMAVTLRDPEKEKQNSESQWERELLKRKMCVIRSDGRHWEEDMMVKEKLKTGGDKDGSTDSAVE